MTGYYNVFNNCREQGLQLIVHGANDVESYLCIWSCQCRDSDQIMVVVGDRTCSDTNNMFDDKAYKQARYFDYNDYNNSTNYVLNILKRSFSKYLNSSCNYKFDCHKSFVDLEKIVIDAEDLDLDYEDYHDLATFENGEFFCDLIIIEGKVGLRYSHYLDDEHNEFENLHFEEFDPDLSSDVSLMLGMKQKLNDFIDNELIYNVEIGSDIKI